MSFRRLEIEGRFSAPPECTVVFDGAHYAARVGEPLALTLLAHGVYVLGRSSKYHRPRGLFCGQGSCGNCVARIQGLPNQRLCTQAAHDGIIARSQNTLGTARFDLLSGIDTAFAGGLDHHHLMVQSAPLNRLAVGFARHLAGLGRLPDMAPDAARTAVGAVPQTVHVQVAVVGAGAAGRAVAQQTDAAGLRTLVLEAGTHDPQDGLDAMLVRGDSRVIGFYDDRELLAVTPSGQLRVRADIIVLCTGAYAQPPACVGNDTPGILSMHAAREALRHGILPGRRVIVAAPPDASVMQQQAAQKLVHTLQLHGVDIDAVVQVPHVASRLHAQRLISVQGLAPNLSVVLDEPHATVDCDALIWCGRPTPAYELARQMGLDTPYSETCGGFVPTADSDGATACDGVFVAGQLAGVEAAQSAAHGMHVGAAVTRKLRMAPATGPMEFA